MRDRRPDATSLAFANASELRVRQGARVVDGLNVPTGIAWTSVESYVVTGLREYNWPMTRLSIRVAQLTGAVKNKAASERLWTEENA